MNGKSIIGWGCLCVALICAGVGMAEEVATAVEKPDPTTSATSEATSAPTPAANARSAAETARRTCINQCEIANGYCNSEVRQARQECSRNAANSGRDPMTLRNDYSTYFCSYFRNPGRHGGRGNYTDRFAHHYDICIDVIQQNIASMRYDCYRNERDAQKICRAELRECQAQCQ